MTDETASIKIYVACLAAYNNGILHGRWIDATLGEDHIWEGIKAMLAASPTPGAEEHAIHDYEGFEGASLGSGLIDHSQKMTVAARAIAERNVVALRS